MKLFVTRLYELRFALEPVESFYEKLDDGVYEDAHGNVGSFMDCQFKQLDPWHAELRIPLLPDEVFCAEDDNDCVEAAQKAVIEAIASGKLEWR